MDCDTELSRVDVREIRYDDLEVVRPLLHMMLREFTSWRAYVDDYDTFGIVIDDFRNRKAIVFTYEQRADRDADAELILHLPDDNDDAAGVPAWLNPHGPLPAMSYEAPLPADSAA